MCFAGLQDKTMNAKAGMATLYGLPGRKKATSGVAHFIAMRTMGWLMGLEPTTTGITILDSTN